MKLKKFARSRIRALIKKLKAFDKDEAINSLHDIRVDIKKIKSILLATENGINGFSAHKNSSSSGTYSERQEKSGTHI